MRKLEHHGVDRRADQIVDAEYIEITGIQPPSEPPAQPPPKKMSDVVKAIIIATVFWVGLLAIVELSSSDTQRNETEQSSSEAATRSPDFAAYIYNDPTSVGGTVMLDELSNSAAPVCNGKMIWIFDAGDKSFTLNGSETSSSGRYEFDGKKLILTNVIEQDANGKAVGTPRSFVHNVSRDAEGRTRIGKISYRQCASTGAGGNERPAQLAEATPVSKPELFETKAAPFSCEAIEATAAEIVKRRTGQEVIEINVEEETIDRGELSCTGTAITGAGSGALHFGTMTTPQGRRLVTAVFLPIAF